MKNIMMGADPEIFVADKDNNLIPSFSFLTDKYNPIRSENGTPIYNDGCQAEFNCYPSVIIDECLDSLKDGMASILNAARKLDKSAKLLPLPVVPVSLEWLATLDPALSQFGCSPSYNIYDISGAAIDGVRCPFRMSGGHLHFGVGELDPALITKIVKALDAVLGVAFVSLCENLDHPDRRKYYGLVGEFRLPPHGLEYRTLSNAWLYSPKSAAMALDFSRKIVQSVIDGTFAWKAEESEVVDSVLRCDVGMARKMLENNREELKNLGYDSTIDLFRPLEESIPTIEKIEANWGIE
jgi:hypothetical protein